MTAKVSIIMPVYNTEATICDSIHSVLNQTFSNWELVIVDDGSPDHAVQRVQDVFAGEERIRLIRKENGGVASARNLGIQNATGEYIAFLDSDDHWTPSFLEKMIQSFVETGYSFGYSGFIKEYAKREARSMGSPFSQGNIILDYASGKQTLWLCSVMIKRDLLVNERLLFSEGIRYMEDVEFLTKILSSSEAFAVKESLATYCWRSSSATNKGWNRNQEDMIMALAGAKEFVINHYFFDDRANVLQAIEQNQATRLIRILWGAILESDFKFAEHLLQKYSFVLDQGGRRIGHQAKAWIVKRPYLWKIVRKFCG